jgi:hypothetical protein
MVTFYAQAAGDRGESRLTACAATPTHHDTALIGVNRETRWFAPWRLQFWGSDLVPRPATFVAFGRCGPWPLMLP